MRKMHLIAGLLAMIFSTPLHSENPFDFWVLRFLQVGENPPCSISGPDFVCENASGILFTAPAGMSSYAWSITGSGSIPGATNQQTVSVTSGAFPTDFTLTLTVTDANNNSTTCTKPVYIYLPAPPANITINPSPACLGVTIDLSISAASSSTVSWTGEGVTNPNGNPSTTAIPTSTGVKTYGVTVTTDYGCVNSGTASVQVNSVPSVSISGPATVCANSTNNVYTATAGMSAYSWGISGNGSIVGATNAQNVSVTAGNSGTYTVTVTGTNANGCTNTASSTVTILPAMALSSTQVNVSCNGDANGSIDLTVSGGAPSYTYNWGPGQPTTQDRTGLAAGTYTVTVTDANNCTKTLSATITQPTAIVLSETHVNVLCNGASSGSIDLTVSGGTPSYLYNWGPGQPTTQDRSGLAAGTYTVTVTDANNCTKTLSATITQPTALTLSSTQVNVSCNGSANGSIDLTVSGGAPSYMYNWGPGQPTTQDRSGLAAGTYTVTVTDANNCTKTLSATITQPSSMSVSVVRVRVPCRGEATGGLNITVSGGTPGYTFDWSNNGPQNPDTDPEDLANVVAGYYTVTITDLNGCQTFFGDTVTQPATLLSLSTTQVNIACQGGSTGSIDLTVTGGGTPYTYAWTGGATTQDRSGLVAGTYTVTVTDGNNCIRTTSATITEPASGISLSGIVTHPTNCFVANGSVDLSVAGGTPAYTYDWSNDGPENPDNDPQDLLNMVEGTFTVTVTDANGCSKTSSFTLDYIDIIPPTLTCPPNATVSANASCQGQVGSYSAASLSDNCNPSPTVTQSPAASTLLTGHNATQTVTLTANDGNGNTSTCTLTVTLKDVSPPTLTCPPNATVNANASCQGQVGSYSAASLSDNCNPSPTVTQSPVSSTILTGHNATQTVTLTANDGNGNTSSCTLTVTLKDVTPPSLTCPPNATVNANANCQGTLGSYSAASLSDNCNPSPTVTQSPVASTVLSGHNTTQLVTLTANDGNGNTATCTLTVTLKDVTPPALTCQGNVTINANASCQGTLGLYTLTAIDNCTSSLGYTQSPSNGTIISGHNTVQVVTLSASDNAGNPASCTLTVTLKDVTPPTLSCPANATVAANASCQGQIGTISPASVSDNCNPSPMVTQSPAASTLLTGHNATQTVTLTANDGNGNTSTCTTTVTLKDATPPSLSCPANTTVNANASCQGTLGSYSAATLSDNCNPSPTVTQSPAASTLLTGHNATQTVTLTASDGNGNTSTCTLTVTLKDVTPPSITCPTNATVNANASCQGTLGSYSAATLSDNCNPSPTATQSPAASTLLSGHNATQTVSLTASDGNGNTSTCTFTVTLKDVTKPTITCPANVTINANASCQGTINAFTPTALSDNCNPTPTLAQSPVAGSTISGHNTLQTVTLTATDVAGNTQTCTLTVTLRDVTPPTILCKTFIANLDATGNVSITPANVFQSGSDNCGVINLVSVVASSFNCSNVGNNLVTLTANDGNGNTATCNATVTVRDITPPVAKCQNVIANLGSNGTVTVSPASVNNGSTDNCSITFTLTPNTFNCSQIGMQTVTLKATDPGGNMSTCTAKVTVRDITAPTAKCKNPTIFLDASGHATLSAAQVNNGSTDNCGIATMSIDWTSFSCSELGGSPWPVKLTLTDVNGNTSSCLGYVTVKDAIAPTAVCEDVTVAIGPNGYALVYGADLAANSDDNCSVWSYSPVAKVYTKYNLGPNNLTITVKDWSGNASTCVSVVTVVLAGNGDFQATGGADGKGIGLYDLVIFPNPTSGEATMAFQLPAEQTFSFRIFDTSGRMIYSREDIGIEGENIMPLRMGDLAPGVYLIDFQSENWKVQKRLVLQR